MQIKRLDGHLNPLFFTHHWLQGWGPIKNICTVMVRKMTVYSSWGGQGAGLQCGRPSLIQSKVLHARSLWIQQRRDLNVGFSDPRTVPWPSAIQSLSWFPLPPSINLPIESFVETDIPLWNILASMKQHISLKWNFSENVPTGSKHYALTLHKHKWLCKVKDHGESSPALHCCTYWMPLCILAIFVALTVELMEILKSELHTMLAHVSLINLSGCYCRIFIAGYY